MIALAIIGVLAVIILLGMLCYEVGYDHGKKDIWKRF